MVFVSLARLPFTSSCAAGFLTCHKLVPAYGLGVGTPGLDPVSPASKLYIIPWNSGRCNIKHLDVTKVPIPKFKM